MFPKCHKSGMTDRIMVPKDELPLVSHSVRLRWIFEDLHRYQRSSPVLDQVQDCAKLDFAVVLPMKSVEFFGGKAEAS